MIPALGKAFLVGALALLVALSPACGDDDDGGARRTGVAELDAVIDAVESQDVDALRALLVFQTLACTTEFGPGGPPKCAEDEAEGTEVEVFAYSSCEPGWLRDDEALTAALDDAVVNLPAIYAAFAPPADFLVGQARPEYVLLFDGDDPRVDEAGYSRGLLVGVEAGRIAAITPGCGAGTGADMLMPEGVDDFLIEPPK